MVYALAIDVGKVREQLHAANEYFAKGLNFQGVKYLLMAERVIRFLPQGSEIARDALKLREQNSSVFNQENGLYDNLRRVAYKHAGFNNPYYKQYFKGVNEPSDSLSILEIGSDTILPDPIQMSLLERRVERIDYTSMEQPARVPVQSIEDHRSAYRTSAMERLLPPRMEQECLGDLEILMAAGWIQRDKARDEVIGLIDQGHYVRYRMAVSWDARNIPYPLDDRSFDEIHIHMMDQPIVSNSNYPHLPSIDDFASEMGRLSREHARFFFTASSSEILVNSDKKIEFFFPYDRQTFDEYMIKLKEALERQGFEIEEFYINPKEEFIPIRKNLTITQINTFASLTNYPEGVDGLLIARKTTK
jgi:hypothetical protein